jgi:hypothetical protein
MQAHQCVYRLSRGDGVIFSDTDNATVVPFDDSVGITQFRNWRDGLGLIADALTVKALVYIVGEVYGAIGNEERATAILVDQRSHIEGRRRYFFCPTLRGSHYDVPPALGRAQFSPVHVVAIYHDLHKLRSRGR